MGARCDTGWASEGMGGTGRYSGLDLDDEPGFRQVKEQSRTR
ncbi:hypothetical protein [Paenibacillus eucommiae]|uniref:Uncharacterized protein n=1 Tax=Paenibacillus eucommiae TaxID=1355755 RepID=A0ABS4JB77_9BACL|nr:hypothetical protein [Paenibacillus eucommiae]MBP1997104.1 hypothetical protein [Paenibacillus eucommiae]